MEVPAHSAGKDRWLAAQFGRVFEPQGGANRAADGPHRSFPVQGEGGRVQRPRRSAAVLLSPSETRPHTPRSWHRAYGIGLRPKAALRSARSLG